MGFLPRRRRSDCFITYGKRGSSSSVGFFSPVLGWWFSCLGGPKILERRIVTKRERSFHFGCSADFHSKTRASLCSFLMVGFSERLLRVRGLSGISIYNLLRQGNPRKREPKEVLGLLFLQAFSSPASSSKGPFPCNSQKNDVATSTDSSRPPF